MVRLLILLLTSCLVLGISYGDNAFNDGHDNYHRIRHRHLKWVNTGDPSLGFRAGRHGPPVCKSWCIVTFYNGFFLEKRYDCCKFREKPGYCPSKSICSWPLPYYLTTVYQCFHDFTCPRGYKCCEDSCFLHKVCHPMVARSQTDENATETYIERTYETPIESIHTTIQGTTENYENVTEDFNSTTSETTKTTQETVIITTTEVELLESSTTRSDTIEVTATTTSESFTTLTTPTMDASTFSSSTVPETTTNEKEDQSTTTTDLVTSTSDVTVTTTSQTVLTDSEVIVDKTTTSPAAILETETTSTTANVLETETTSSTTPSTTTENSSSTTEALTTTISKFTNEFQTTVSFKTTTDSITSFKTTTDSTTTQFVDEEGSGSGDDYEVPNPREERASRFWFQNRDEIDDEELGTYEVI